MVLEKFSLEDRVGIVTGGGRGLGKVFCRSFADVGANIVVAEIDTQTGPETAAELEGMGRQALFVETDVTDRSSCFETVRKTLEAFGRVDFLMNNAGIVHQGEAESVSEADWRKVIDVDLNGVFFCCQAVAEPMIEQKSGSIINIASMSGIIVNYPQSQASYNAAKAGVAHLTKSLASEWAQHRIRVNAISPGYMRTDMTAPMIEDPEYGGRWLAATPMGRAGEPEELGPVAVFLASDASSFVTGADIIADGGFTIW
ncbi:MAG: glucose 1-dehydrogenase [Candidatus Latescibacteria bacterium]|jgi:NAD(P)-dependent dehydrogenase (short-subunit alcohol dehydrogenase family)|nr:glucose 1-dehydrogenase [Candidatus Latescibacterota bacterium]